MNLAINDKRTSYREENLYLLRAEVEAPHAVLPNLLGRLLPSLRNLHCAAPSA